MGGRRKVRRAHTPSPPLTTWPMRMQTKREEVREAHGAATIADGLASPTRSQCAIQLKEGGARGTARARPPLSPRSRCVALHGLVSLVMYADLRGRKKPVQK